MTVITSNDTPLEPVEPLADVETMALRLGVSERSVQRLAKSGRIPHYRVGGQLRFDMAEALQALRVVTSG